MSTKSFNPATTGKSRVFLIDGSARPDHEPIYKSCLRSGAPSQSFGDIERIECGSDEAYDNFVEVGSIQGAVDRPTNSLVGRYALDEASELLEIAKKRCAVDVQVHFGQCTDPRSFTKFTKVLVYEKATITNWASDDLGALSSDENAAINETADISGKEMYEILPLTLAEKGADTVTNAIIDGVSCDQPGCGECDNESDGCNDLYFVSLAAGGSPGTPADVYYSINKGVGWALNQINTLLPTEEPTGIACIDDYIVVISNDSDSLHYKTKANVDAGVVAGWTEIAAGIVAAGSPNAIWGVGNYGFIVGDGGYVYGCADPTVGVTVLDAGVATTEDLYAVHAISDKIAVGVGDNDAIVYTTDRINWQLATATGGGNDLTAVWMKNKDEWFVGDNAGNLYYTLDGGVTWTLKAFPGSAAGSVLDLYMPTDSIMYLSHVTAANAGRILRSIDGGFQFYVLPEGAGTIPTNAGLYFAGCKYDPNFIAAGGSDAAVPTDGIIIIGRD